MSETSSVASPLDLEIYFRFKLTCVFLISSSTPDKREYINRGSYMSARVLLNVLNELGKRDKMRGLSSILSLFRSEFNKFINTGARILDSIYHITLKLFKMTFLA